ncbi:helix-turn-helix transcriptional regulator [Methylobacterium sp. WSM2598]|uniref:helix-turn-helix transcriptional regulator n=1 Tax=Methylobacterium sp. WSM2598 TaxID=398261 RepID=UPI00047752B9|nr:helix-turn-helix transcriptional regulator [Methylobacterium sp. WSM2598]
MPLGQPLLEALDCMGYGGLLLGKTGQVLRINRTAEHLLAGQADPEQGEDRLALCRAALDKVLRAQTEAALNSRQADWIAVPQDVSDAGRPLIVRTVSINQPAPGGPHKVVILVNLDANPHPSPEVLKRIFSLTSSEARLAIEIAAGRSPEEIADAAHVAVGTVRKQLATVFAKTNTHRQAELVALLTRLAILP